MLKGHRSRRASDAGFTLLELLVVLTIIGLLATLAVPQVARVLGGARTSTAQSQIERLASILEIYNLDTGTYPSTQQGLSALIERPGGVGEWNGPYVQNFSAIVDPWGTPFDYRGPDGSAPFIIMSFGSDGAAGGEGDARDVSSADILTQ